MIEEVKLTPDQQVAVDAMVAFLDDKEGPDVFTLSGVAGAGKTFSIKQALHGRSNIVGAVISHSAKSILSESLEGVASCITVAQLLGLTMRVNDDGEVNFLPNRNRDPRFLLPIDSADILIIDECSMIDKGLHDMIMSMKKKSTKIIYMGDIYQLAPINSGGDSVTFDYIGATLNTAVRYTGPIADLGNRIKKEIDKINNDESAISYVLNEWQIEELGNDCRTSQVNADGSGYIFLNDVNKAVEIAAKAFKNQEDPNYMKLLAYRNSSVNTLNDVIRAQTHKCPEYTDKDGNLNLPQFVKNELVICEGGYSVDFMAGDGNMRTHSLIYNNQTFKVLDTMDIKGPMEVPKHGSETGEMINVPCLTMSLSPKLDIPEGAEIYVMDYKNFIGRRSYYDYINALKKRAQASSKRDDWKKYYNFLGKFAEFKYNYAQTTHRSQGRTYEDIIVFDNDIMSIQKSSLKSKLQSLYVAVTRAKKLVFIYNKKYRVNQDELPESVRKEFGI